MSIGPLGLIGAAAGSPLAQQKGSDSERAAQDQATQARQLHSARQAAKSEGIGETQQDHEATDRDADGRRVWEREKDSPEENPSQEGTVADHLSRDATGERGNQLDLTG